MDVTDAAVYRLFGETLCQPAVMRSLLGSIIEHQPQQEDGRAAAQREVERIEKRRVRVLDMYERGDIDREEYIKRQGDVDRALSSARAAVAQAPPPVMDMHALVRGLAGAFARFSSLPAAERWELLRRAVRDIFLDGPAIPSITFRGGFLGEILDVEVGPANLSTHARLPRRGCAESRAFRLTLERFHGAEQARASRSPPVFVRGPVLHVKSSCPGSLPVCWFLT
jgi:hypothetical protein